MACFLYSWVRMNSQWVIYKVPLEATFEHGRTREWKRLTGCFVCLLLPWTTINWCHSQRGFLLSQADVILFIILQTTVFPTCTSFSMLIPKMGSYMYSMSNFHWIQRRPKLKKTIHSFTTTLQVNNEISEKYSRKFRVLDWFHIMFY